MASPYGTTLNPAEKIIASKIAFNQIAPFFSYLIQHMRINEMPPEMLAQMPTMAVNGRGDMFYAPDFVAKLTTEELRGCMCHEVLHLAFEHPKRSVGKDVILANEQGMQVSLWNIAIDIVVNAVVLANGFRLPACAHPVNLSEDSSTFMGKVIEKVSEKSAETIYDELLQHLKSQVKKQKKGKKGDGASQDGSGKAMGVADPNNELGQGFDKHDFDRGKKPQSDAEDAEGSAKTESKSQDWGKLLKTAQVYAKQRGKEPAGLGREYEILGRSYVPWRAILQREVAKGIPFDFTWSRPSPKLYANGFYFPATTGEQVVVLGTLDLSGSVDQKELGAYVTELLGITKAFPQVTLRILTHDSEVHDDILVCEANRSKLANLKLHGGGGTSHVTVHEYIKAHKYNKKYSMVFHLTDGYTDWPKIPAMRTYVILGGNHCNPKDTPSWVVGTIAIDGHY